MPFYKWLLGQESTLNTADMHHIDLAFSRSVIEMEKVALQKLRMVIYAYLFKSKSNYCN